MGRGRERKKTRRYRGRKKGKKERRGKKRYKGGKGRREGGKLLFTEEGQQINVSILGFSGR